MDDIKTIVREFLVRDFLVGADVQLADDTSFMQRHVLDSTGFIELISFVEERFGFSVSDAEMLPENFDSLANIEAYVRRKRG
ncbi:MAG: acyl carrier protein [Betaproteobacteria bacterium]|nr:acyl carrier protein [Betaproteobacteria bacterium]